jgi:hypothetical protein
MIQETTKRKGHQDAQAATPVAIGIPRKWIRDPNAFWPGRSALEELALADWVLAARVLADWVLADWVLADWDRRTRGRRQTGAGLGSGVCRCRPGHMGFPESGKPMGQCDGQ